MITFRKTLMATTMLAGLAIFAFDAAQAGPNGGPSLGSISGFSSMRMDFNRVGGSNRALSRDDMRVVPLEVKKTIPSGIMPLPGKKDDKKNIAKKKDTNVARVSNSKPANGGKGKEDIGGGGPNLHIPAAIEELYRITGGNLDDLAQIAALADQIKTGPLVVASPLFPVQGGGTFTPPSFGGGGPKGGEQSDRNFLDGWAGYSSAPGGPDTSKSGWASLGGGWSQSDRRENGNGSTRDYTNSDGRTGQVADYTDKHDGGTTDTHRVEARGRDSAGHPTEDTIVTETDRDTDGNVTGTTRTETHVSVEEQDGEKQLVTETIVTTRDANGTVTGRSHNQDSEPYSPGNRKDSQPVAEGSGRPSNGGGGWCSPTGGCYRPARNGSPRIIPAETDGGGTVSAHRQSPSWATDPNPDGLGGTGGGSGYSGYTPEDEEDGDNGGPGNPALEALNAAL